MGTYYNPPENISKVGRRLYPMSRTYEAATKELRPGERLYALLYNGMYYAAPLLDSKAEFDAHRGTYEMGRWLEMSLYALPEGA